MNVCSKYERFMTNTGSQVKYSVARTTIVVRAKSTLHLSLEMSKTITMSGTYKKKCAHAKSFFLLENMSSRFFPQVMIFEIAMRFMEFDV